MLCVAEDSGAGELMRVIAPTPSFDELYRAHFEYVTRCVRRLGVESAQIEDAVQDVFVVMHRRIHDLRPDASAKAFLFAIAARVANGYRRTLRRKGAASLDVGSLADPRESPFERTAWLQAERVLQHFLDVLDGERRAVFLMAELEEMTAPEISRALHVNLSTVYTRLRAARLRFASYVSASGKVDPRSHAAPAD